MIMFVGTLWMITAPGDWWLIGLGICLAGGVFAAWMDTRWKEMHLE